MSSRKSADTAPAMVVGGDLVLAAHRIWICTPPPAPLYLRPAAAMRVRGRGGGVLSDLACRTGARRARAARCGAVRRWVGSESETQGSGNESGEGEERAGSGCLSYVPLDGGAWMLSDVELLFLLVDRLKPDGGP